MNRQSSTTRSDLESMLIDQTGEPKALPLSLLEEITDGFSDEQQIGEGGFATVYKGVLENGAVAVKRLSNTHMFEKEFHREVECLMMVRHKNVVRFLGYCADTQGSMERYDGKLVMADVQKRLLCFEYLNNGSLDKYITGASSGLDWRNRYKIIKGIVEGLHYLHEKNIVHLDLKPANILLDDSMVPKIADFGLSRCFHEHQTRIMASKIGGTFGYMAPEFGNGVITRRFDIYSLGVIFIELLKGQKGYHAVENVLESWRTRLEKSTEKTQLDQIRVCAEIGIECIESNPLKRPVTQQIIDRLNEMENVDGSMHIGVPRSFSSQVETASGELHDGTLIIRETTSEASSSTSNELIKVDPLELRFPFLPNMRVSCSMNLVNNTPYYVAFNTWVQNDNVAIYYTDPAISGIIPPHSTKGLVISRVAKEGAVQDIVCKDKYFIWSSIVNENSEASGFEYSMDITRSMVLPIVLTKVPASSSTSNQLIKVDPLELCFPFLPNMSVSCSMKLVNNTSYYVVFNTWVHNDNVAIYNTYPAISGIIPPHSNKCLAISRVAKEGTVQDIESKDRYFIWSSIVNENSEARGFECSMDITRSMDLPIVLTKVPASSSPINELIKVEPLELRFPFLPTMRVSCSVKLVNNTPYYVVFNTWVHNDNVGIYYTDPTISGIIPPHSNKCLGIHRVAKEGAVQDIECKDKYFIWSSIVNENSEASGFEYSMDKTRSMGLPIVLTKVPASSSTSNKLIKVDPLELCFPFLPNMRVSCPLKLVNNTPYYIVFNTWVQNDNVAVYYTDPAISGIIPPHSNKCLVISRVAKEGVVQDIDWKDKYFIWSSIVNENSEANSFQYSMDITQSMGLPIVLTKVPASSSTSNELIQVDPLELRFPFLPNMRVSCSMKLVNNTPYYVGFNTWVQNDNVAIYYTDPTISGILPPHSNKCLVVSRVAKEGAVQDIKCKDKYFIWSSIVNENSEASGFQYSMDISQSMDLPIILTKVPAV